MAQFRSVRQNVQCAKEWKRSVGTPKYLESLVDYDAERESSLDKLCKHRDKFTKNLRKEDGMHVTA